MLSSASRKRHCWLKSTWPYPRANNCLTAGFFIRRGESAKICSTYLDHCSPSRRIICRILLFPILFSVEMRSWNWRATISSMPRNIGKRSNIGSSLGKNFHFSSFFSWRMILRRASAAASAAAPSSSPVLLGSRRCWRSAMVDRGADGDASDEEDQATFGTSSCITGVVLSLSLISIFILLAVPCCVISLIFFTSSSILDEKFVVVTFRKSTSNMPAVMKPVKSDWKRNIPLLWHFKHRICSKTPDCFYRASWA